MRKEKIFKNLKIALIFSLAFSAIIPFSNIQTIQAAGHTHSASCYQADAKKHTHIGSPNKYGGCYTSSSDLHDCGGTIKWKAISNSQGKCPQCGNTIKITTYSGTSNKCGETFNCTIYERCSKCKYKVTQVDDTAKVIYPNTECKYRLDNSVRPTYELSCGMAEGDYCDSFGNKLTPLCTKVATNIEVVSSTQTGTEPDTRIIITYLDGHTEYGKATSTDFNKDKTYNNETIKFTYSGEVGQVGNQGELYAHCLFTSSGAEKTNVNGQDLSPEEIARLLSEADANANTNTNTNTSGGNNNKESKDEKQPELNEDRDVEIVNPNGNYNRNTNNGSRKTPISNSKNGYTISGKTPNTNKLNNDVPSGIVNEQKQEDAKDGENKLDTIARKLQKITFTSEKEVLPTSSFGTLHFTENVRNETNATKGTAPTTKPQSSNTNTNTSSSEEKTTTTPSKTQKDGTKTLVLGLVALIFIILIGLGCYAFTKIKEKKKDKEIQAKHMNLSNRLNP